jgi:hypothetical protein
VIVDTNPGQIYVGQNVSITVNVSTSANSPAVEFLEFKVDRDLPSNAATTFVGSEPFSILNPRITDYQPGTWYLQTFDDPASQWVQVFPSLAAAAPPASAVVNYSILPSAAGQTLTTEVQLFVDNVSTSISAFANVVVPLVTPTSNITNTPTITPTPIANTGQIVAYPQPASSQICFDYVAPAGNDGNFQMYVYNLAFQLVARIQDQGVSGVVRTTCVNISGLAPGVYVYQAQQGNFQFPPGRFGVVH